MEEWKNEYYYKIEQEYFELLREKENLLEKKAESYLTEAEEQRLEKIEKRKKDLYKKRNFLDSSEYFEFKVGLDVIAYIVSRIETKKYNWQEQDICFWYLYNDFVTKAECSCIYLVEEGMEELARLEILATFPKETEKTTLDQKIQSTLTYKELSKIVGDLYTPIAFSKTNSSPNIRCQYFKDPVAVDPFSGLRQDKITAYVSNKSFPYLAIIMEKLAEYKYELFELEGRNLQEKDIYKIVDKIIEEDKNIQQFKKESATKK